jgi:hypothetical protein
MDEQWFLTRNGETIAQFSTEKFKRAVSKGIVRPGDYVRRSDSSALILADDFLPKPHRKPRSAALPFLAAGLVLAGIFGGVFYGLSRLEPTLLQAAMDRLAQFDKSAQAAVQREVMRQVLLSDTSDNRFFKALAEKDPQAFEDMLTHFSDTTGEAAQDIVPKAREYLMKNIIEPRSRYLADDDKVAMLSLNRDFGAQLAGSNAKMCIAHALGKPYGDMRPFITPELAQREEDLMLKMLDAEPQTYDLAPAKEVQALNGKVAMALYQAHGDDVALLDLENVPDGKEEQACRMFGAYLDGVLNLPQDERVALVRAIVLDPDRLSGENPAAAEPQTPASEGAQGAADAPVPVDIPPADTAAQSDPSETGSAPDALPEAPAPREATPPSDAQQ